jgi:hypothetical protein
VENHDPTTTIGNALFVGDADAPVSIAARQYTFRWDAPPSAFVLTKK